MDSALSTAGESMEADSDVQVQPVLLHSTEPATSPYHEQCHLESPVKDSYRDSNILQPEPEIATETKTVVEKTTADPSLTSIPESSVVAQKPSPKEDDPAHQVYHVKWICWEALDGRKIPIVTQNENGPCPLLAITNVLLLRGQIHLQEDVEIVSGQQLMGLLGDCILRLSSAVASSNTSGVSVTDYEQNVSDAMGTLSRLFTGLDVNVKFTGVSEFEYTPECLVFDLLNIPLYHGWLCDPSDRVTWQLLSGLSYNQLVEKIVSNKSSTEPTAQNEALICEEFLTNTASQLTEHGLMELSAKLKDGELAVLFRNNHFSTLYKHKDALYLLVTDQGFLHEKVVAWESLNCVTGDSEFFDSQFEKIPPKEGPLTAPSGAPLTTQEQINHDYLLALSLHQEAGELGGNAEPPQETTIESTASEPSMTE